MSGAARIRIIGPALAVIAALLACSEEREPPLPPPRLEARNAALEEVRARLKELPAADVARVSTLTHHADHRVRRAAALRLMEMGPAAAPALGDLIALLKDKHPRVRTAASRALAETGAPEAIDPLITCLVDRDRQVRLWCWIALRKFGDQAIPAIADGLVTGSPMRRLSYQDEADRRRSGHDEIIDRLVSLGAVAAEPLAAKLSVEDAQLRGALLRILGRMGAEAQAALPAMIALLDPAIEADTQFRALQAIERVGDLHPDVVPAVKRAVESKDEKVSGQAKKTLAALQKAKPANPPPEKKGPPPGPRTRLGRTALPSTAD